MRKMLFLLSFFVFSALPAFANCLIFERARLLDKNFQDVRIDHKAKEKWIAAQEKNLQPAARFLADNLRVISRAEYENAMVEGLSKILEKIPNESSIALLLPATGAGHIWNTRYAQLLLPRLRSATLVNEDAFLNFLKNRKGGSSLHVLSIDDFSYSGTQLSGEVLSTVSSIPKDYRANTKLHFFRVGGTKLAKSYAEDMVLLGPEKVQATVDFAIEIPVLDELPGYIPHEGFSTFSAREDKPLTVPFFKMPDLMSFPTGLKKGFVPGKDPLPFIVFPESRSGEPYRNTPFKDSDLSKFSGSDWIQPESPKAGDKP